MKRTFFYLLVLFAVSLSANAEEESKRLLVDGRVWKMMNVTKEYYPDKGWCSDTTFYSVQVKGEVEFEGKKVSYIDLGYNDFLYMYEDNTGVYRYNSYEGWRKVFDFNLKIGEKDPFLGEGFSVDVIDMIEVDGIAYKRWIIGKDIVVEGVGSLNDGLRLSDWFTPSVKTCLYAVYDSDKCIFTKADFTKEATGIRDPKIKVEPTGKTLYNLSGRRLNTVPRKGIYIKDGKKVVVK